jgi:hypothetical protein
VLFDSRIDSSQEWIKSASPQTLFDQLRCATLVAHGEKTGRSLAAVLLFSDRLPIF